MEKRKRKQVNYSESDETTRISHRDQDPNLRKKPSKPLADSHLDSDGDDFVDLKPMYSIQKKKFQDKKSKSQESLSSHLADPSDDDVVGKDVKEKQHSGSSRKSWSEKREELELQRVLELSKKEFIAHVAPNDSPSRLIHEPVVAVTLNVESKSEDEPLFLNKTKFDHAPSSTKKKPKKSKQPAVSITDSCLFSESDGSHFESARASSPDLLDTVFEAPLQTNDSIETIENQEPQDTPATLEVMSPLPNSLELLHSVPESQAHEAVKSTKKAPEPHHAKPLLFSNSTTKPPLVKPLSHVPLRLGLSKKSRLKPLLNIK